MCFFAFSLDFCSHRISFKDEKSPQWLGDFCKDQRGLCLLRPRADKRIKLSKPKIQILGNPDSPWRHPQTYSCLVTGRSQDKSYGKPQKSRARQAGRVIHREMLLRGSSWMCLQTSCSATSRSLSPEGVFVAGNDSLLFFSLKSGSGRNRRKWWPPKPALCKCWEERWKGRFLSVPLVSVLSWPFLSFFVAMWRFSAQSQQQQQCRGYPGWMAWRRGTWLTPPQAEQPISKGILYQLTTSPQPYQWEMTIGTFSLLYPTRSLWKANGRHCCIWAALRFVRKSLVCSSPKAPTQQEQDELLGAARMNQGQVLQDILTCLGSLS